MLNLAQHPFAYQSFAYAKFRAVVLEQFEKRPMILLGDLAIERHRIFNERKIGFGYLIELKTRRCCQFFAGRRPAQFTLEPFLWRSRVCRSAIMCTGSAPPVICQRRRAQSRAESTTRHRSKIDNRDGNRSARPL